MSEKTVEDLNKEIEVLKETFAVFVGFIIKDVVKKFGDEGRKTISDACRAAGLWQTKKYLEKSGVKEKGTKAFARHYMGIGDVSTFLPSVLELTEKRYVIKTDTCPYLKYWREMNLHKELPEFCDLACAWDEGTAKAFNPKLKLTLTKNMLKGDDFCVYVWEEEDSLPEKENCEREILKPFNKIA